MRKPARRIGEILVEKGLITEAQLQEALLEQKLGNAFIGEILIKNGRLSKEHFLEVLSEQFNIPLVSLKEQNIDLELVSKFPSFIDYEYFPLFKDDDSITVAIVNPLDALALSRVEEETKPLKVKLVLVSEDDLKGLIQKYRQQLSQNIQRLLKKGKEKFV